MVMTSSVRTEVGTGVGDGSKVGVGLGVSVGVGVLVGVAVAVGNGVTVGVWVGVEVGDGVQVGVDDGVIVGVLDGCAVTVTAATTWAAGSSRPSATNTTAAISVKKAIIATATRRRLYRRSCWTGRSDVSLLSVMPGLDTLPPLGCDPWMLPGFAGA
jgi:hypothetical protein